jgi:hypothetical protein
MGNLAAAKLPDLLHCFVPDAPGAGRLIDSQGAARLYFPDE